jgi:alpha-1,3-mannosyltransferase
MRIVHVTRQFWPGVGGLENVVDNLARCQVGNGHDVRVVTLDHIFDATDDTPLPASEIWNGIAIRRIPFRGSRRYPVAPSVLRHIRHADIIHVHAVDFFVDYLALTRFLHGRKMILSTHGGFFHTQFASRLKHVYFNSITRLSLIAFDAIAASGVEDGRRFAALSPHKVVTIENGVDIAKFAGLADPTRRTILYFGRLAPNKGLDRLIAWFARLHAFAPHWQLVIAGKPMGVSVETIRKWALQAHVSAHVAVHDTPSDAALADLIRNAGFYACASRFEGFGLAAVEAASAGLALLLSDIPPFRQTVARLGAGDIVDFDMSAQGMPALAAKLERQAAAPARPAPDLASFGWDAVGQRFEQLYAAVMRGDRPA